ncbi:hypothetical protein H5185_04850 [Shewanella sp. SG44-6]|jgi:hypothetical protein|uniref:hypothetical protein n=1 Tax=Shewanella sp. SG44-6 TaxID=2760959 RepID=UPI0016028BD6|nr:hypothetical protein [Shewanella sp. SG44-6]MBB1388752.1 hypothetical protein [Shewanella sp. SG44-6]
MTHFYAQSRDNQLSSFDTQTDYSQNNQQANDLPQNDNERVFEKNVCIYGSSSALTVVTTKTKTDQYHTLTIEGARSLENKPRYYQWNDKIILQLTRSEIPYFIGVLVGMISKAEFNNHGAKKNKSMKIEFQGNKFFMNITEGGKKAVAVPISLDDALSLSLYAIDIYMRNYSNLSPEIVLKLISKTLSKKVVKS